MADPRVPQITACGTALTVPRAERRWRAVPLILPPASELRHLLRISLISAQLTAVPRAVLSLPRLEELRLSRNYLKDLPADIAWATALPRLVLLDLSRNGLRELPPGFGLLPALATLSLRSNHLKNRPSLGHELRRLPRLRRLDVRFNEKLRLTSSAAAQALVLPEAEVDIQFGREESDCEEEEEEEEDRPGANGGEKGTGRLWPSLAAQLAPLSTPQLRERLRYTFDDPIPARRSPARATLMARLLRRYADRRRSERKNGAEAAAIGKAAEEKKDPGCVARPVKHGRGQKVPPELTQELLGALRKTSWPQERDKLSATGYLVLERAAAEAAAAADSAVLVATTSTTAASVAEGSGTTKVTRRQRRATDKCRHHHRLWSAASAVMRFVAPDFPYTAVACTFGFRGSPHIDTYDISHQYAVSVGTWQHGGELCVESGPDLVSVVDTRDKVARVDGRLPHWVSPYEQGGERFSVIWFVTRGETTPILTMTEMEAAMG